MHDFPHHYEVTASAGSESYVCLQSEGIEDLESAGPAQFGGPGDRWSPEALLAASVADCFVLSFRAIARASRFDWTSIRCDVLGVLDRVDKVTQFTRFREDVVLEVPEGSNEDKAIRLLHKAEHNCLITNSLTAEVELSARVVVSG